MSSVFPDSTASGTFPAGQPAMGIGANGFNAPPFPPLQACPKAEWVRPVLPRVGPKARALGARPTNRPRSHGWEIGRPLNVSI